MKQINFTHVKMTAWLTTTGIGHGVSPAAANVVRDRQRGTPAEAVWSYLWRTQLGSWP